MKHHHYHQNLPDRLLYYINSDNNRYEVIWYMCKKRLYIHIYPSTYDVLFQIILPNKVLLHICDGNEHIILLHICQAHYDTYAI